MRLCRALIVTGGCLFGAFGSVCAQTPGGDPDSALPFTGRPIDDERIYVHGIFNQFEGRVGSGQDSFRWDGEAWAGTDMNRLWIKSEGFVTPAGQVEDGLHQFLYDRPISTYFDVQAGLRYDLDSAPSRPWAALGVQGMAPLFVETEATLYARDAGHYAARLELSHDMLLTQRLILQPEIEMDFYTKDDPARGIGPGLSDIDTGLRLRYEITRKVAPYLGVAYHGKFGQTATFAREDGDSTDNVSFVVGFRAWF